MHKYVIGIDPGHTGGLTIFKNEKFYKTYKSENKFDKFDSSRIGRILLKYRKKDVFVYLEDVHSVHKASAKANFEFGKAVGAIEALLDFLAIPYQKVQPKVWQKIAWIGIPKIKKSGKNSNDTKKMSRMAVDRLFPKLDLRADTDPKSRCRVPHMGKVDSLLIGYYGSYRFKENGD